MRLIYLPRIVSEANMKRLQDHIGTALSDTGYIDKDIVGQDFAGVERARSDRRRHSIRRSPPKTRRKRAKMARQCVANAPPGPKVGPAGGFLFYRAILGSSNSRARALRNRIKPILGAVHRRDCLGRKSLRRRSCFQNEEASARTWRCSLRSSKAATTAFSSWPC